MIIKNISRWFYTLSSQIFIVYWISLALMLGIVFLIAQLNFNGYKVLTEEELKFYQQEITESIREHSLGQLVYEKKPECNLAEIQKQKQTKYIRPVVLDSHNKIACALNEDAQLVLLFLEGQPSDLSRATKKVIANQEIAGPFRIFFNEKESYQLYLLRPINPQEEVFNYIGKYPFLILLLVMVISTPILFLLAHFIGKPTHDLGIAANEIAQGNFKINKKLEHQGPSETRLVGISFNKMAQSINELISSQQQLLSSISHELRTPLTRLQLASSLLRHKVGENKELQRIETEIDRLNLMINDLLMSSRNIFHSHTEKSQFTIHAFLENVLDDAKFEAEQKHIHFEVSQQNLCAEQYNIIGNLSALTSAFENVLRNALKYTKNHVFVTIQQVNSSLFIYVEDNGKGIPKDQYEKIFKPFYRVDEARTRSSGGVGLGLSIVKNVILQHTGEVWAEQSHLGGLKVIIKLPITINRN